MENYQESWLCSYDSANRLFTLLCTSKKGASENSNWSTLYRLDNLSDPDGNFVVFAGTDFIGPSKTEELSTFPIVKIEIKADESGDPITLHKSFNDQLLGSPTLFGPPELFGEDRHDFIWFTGPELDLWLSSDAPTRWESRKYWS